MSMNDNNLFLQITVIQSETERFHERKVYNIMDLLGDIGGILEAFTIFWGIIILPFSEFEFYQSAASKLFYVKAS